MKSKIRSLQKPSRSAKANGNQALAEPVAHRRDKLFSIDRNRKPDAPRPRIVAQDTETQRIILGIAGHRLALDFTIGVTELKPASSYAPASVSILRQRNGKPGMAKDDGERGTKESHEVGGRPSGVVVPLGGARAVLRRSGPPWLRWVQGRVLQQRSW